jgi:hypothetical protein
MCAGLEVSPGSKNCAKRANKNTSNKGNVFKIKCCGSYSQLPTEKGNKTKSLEISKQNRKRKALDML